MRIGLDCQPTLDRGDGETEIGQTGADLIGAKPVPGDSPDGDQYHCREQRGQSVIARASQQVAPRSSKIASHSPRNKIVRQLPNALIRIKRTSERSSTEAVQDGTHLAVPQMRRRRKLLLR